MTDKVIVASTPKMHSKALELIRVLRDLGYALTDIVLTPNSNEDSFEQIALHKVLLVCIGEDYKSSTPFFNRLLSMKGADQEPILLLNNCDLTQLSPTFLFHCHSNFLEWTTPTHVAASAVLILEKFISPSGNHPLVAYAKAQAAIPLSDIEVPLKQVQQSQLNELGQLALNFIFEGYSDDISDEAKEKAKRIQEQMPMDGVTHKFDFRRTRRFAGDHTLARGKYHSVAKDASGFDEGVLIGELMAYYNPLKAGIIEIYDLTVTDYKRLFEKKYGREIHRRGVGLLNDCIVIVFFLSSCTSHPFTHLTQNDQTLLFIAIPVTVTIQKIPRTLDLRQPAVADWFAKHFSTLVWNQNGLDVPVFPNKKGVDSFEKILPSLLTQQIGGGGFTMVVGWWLRKHGVNALIFPSARFDSRVQVMEGKMIDFCGWNLVDYRESPPGDIDFRFDISATWPDIIENSPDQFLDSIMGKEKIRYEDVDIQFTKTGSAAGSWEVKGLIARRLASVQLAKLLSQLAATNVSDETTRIISGWLYQMKSNQAKTAHAEVLIWALLGVDKAKANVLKMGKDAASKGYGELAKAFEEVVQKSPIMRTPPGTYLTVRRNRAK